MFAPCYTELSVPSIFARRKIESWLLFVNCLPAGLWLCTVPWVGLQCGIVIHVFTGQTQFSVISSIYYSQNRSALLCKLKRDNSLLTIYSVNYLRNEFNFWNVHGIMNTSGLLQS